MSPLIYIALLFSACLAQLQFLPGLEPIATDCSGVLNKLADITRAIPSCKNIQRLKPIVEDLTAETIPQCLIPLSDITDEKGIQCLLDLNTIYGDLANLLGVIEEGCDAERSDVEQLFAKISEETNVAANQCEGIFGPPIILQTQCNLRR
eukprot:TRINITY_DN953_c0_g1_i2.p1 TRINITY_DN953_c0_g1~~TRINITY_DN953_c0_g1_i2.p1  ORF type:complete len:150 (-),score=27.34 TRINITY_DN953_c0_g1_i2:387-836(-)